MGCQYDDPTHNGASSFTVAMPRLTFGRGTLNEIGARATRHQLKKVALFTDPYLLDGPLVATALESLEKAGLSATVFSEIRVEPCDDTVCLLYTSPSPRDGLLSRMPSSA